MIGPTDVLHPSPAPHLLVQQKTLRYWMVRGSWRQYGTE